MKVSAVTLIEERLSVAELGAEGLVTAPAVSFPFVPFANEKAALKRIPPRIDASLN